MPNHTGVPPFNPTKYKGPNIFYPLCVTRNREPTGDDFRQPETGALYPFDSFWLVGKDPTTGTQGDLWYLSKIVSSVAYWVKLSTGISGPLLKVQVDGALAPGINPVEPTGAGLMRVTGSQVATGTTTDVIRTFSNALNEYEIQIQRATTAASTTVGLNGVSHFNSAHFTVDASGFVSLAGGGSALDSVTVQSVFAPGVNPVVANAGNINLNGTLVAAGNTPIQSTSRAANTAAIEVQISQAVASTNISNNGMAHFDSDDFNVDSDGFVKSKGSQLAPGVANIGFSYNAGTGTFTVHGQDGMALSASNPAFITMQDPAAFGELLTISVTANQDFIDDNGASQIIGNLFGLTTGIATSVDIPFFLYAVMNDAMNNIAFMISRFPNATTAPVAAKIGMPSTPAADTQGSFFSLENVTAADYEGNTCMSIGSFRMRMSAADDWTVQALAARDGIGHYQEGLQFAFPRGQFGSASGKVFKNNGTPPAEIAPDDSDGGFTYYVDSENNRIFWQLAFPAIDTIGVGAVNAQLAMPYERLEGATSGSGFINNAGSHSGLFTYTLPGSNTAEFSFVNSATTGFLLNDNFVLNLAVAINGTLAIQYS